jgi:hypothetical protein
MRMGQVLQVRILSGTTVLLGALVLCAACKSSGSDQPSPALTALQVTPSQVDLAPAAAQQFTVAGQWSDGGSTTPPVTWSATGGTIGTDGLYAAGSTPGVFRAIALHQGGALADTAAITIASNPAVLTALVLSPPTVSLLAAATRQFSVSGTWSDGSHAVPAVNYSATGGTMTPGGLFAAGGTAGAFRVIAVQQGGTLADTSAITITVPPPTLTQVILTPPSASLAAGATQQFAVSGNWSDGSHAVPAVNYTATGGTITAGGLYTAGATAGAFRVIAVQQGGTLADTSAVTITAVGGTTLFTEDFETTDFLGKGWYDQTTIPTSTAAHTTGSTRSMMWHWGVGTVNPLTAGAARHKFTPSSSLYISYWVKFSTNFVGSGKTYHPHEFTVLTTESMDYAGLAHTPLTLLVETTWSGSNGIPRMEGADGSNVDLTHGAVPNDLTAVTELRSACGCNGNPDGLNVACYNSGGSVWDNTKLKDAASAQFLSTTGPKYKNDWHHVEAYFQLNTIVGGIGLLNGIMQYWVDGNLVIDQQAVQFRTGAHPTMLLNQFVASPYIGDGSPVDQTEWIDDLVVRTSKP